MLFNSYIFIFLFFPICLAGFYGLLYAGKRQAAKVFLLGMSLWFYGYFSLKYLWIMAGSIVFNYCMHRILSEYPKKIIAFLAVMGNLGVLFYFKYFDFFLTSMNQIFGTSMPLRGILLPLGISFFTFQQISFIVDTFRGEIKDCDAVTYALFVAFFPQLIAGPIVNHGEMLPQFESIGQKQAEWERFGEGFGLFVLGMAKKALLADTFGAGVDYGYANVLSLGRFDAALVIAFYTLQLYFDFSGYCDMARGIGKMLGVELPVNFNSPYKATNIVDFWKRWHITLNRFFTKYVYIPLGGNRKGEIRMYVNLLAVFLLSGLWHGAGWNYIVWGALHGILYVMTRWWQRWQKGCGKGKDDISVVIEKEEQQHKWDGRRIQTNIMTCVSRVLLFIYVSAAWVYFRAQDVSQANRMLLAVVKGPVQKVSLELADCLKPDEFWYCLKVLHLDNLAYSRYILMALILLVGIYLAMVGKNAAQRMERVKYRAGSAVVFAVLAVWCILTFSRVSTFLYFNF